jgi:hypothetical protein
MSEELDKIKAAIEPKIEGSALEYWLDSDNGVRLNQGNLYRLTRTEKKENARLLLSAPLILIGAVKTDEGTKIRYVFSGGTKTATLKEMVTDISVNMHSPREANKSLSELLYRYVDDQIKNHKILIEHDPIYAEDGTIHVSFDTSDISVKHTLQLLRDFYEIATNPHAFLSGLAFNLVAPLAFFIRTDAPFGYLFPQRISYGQTGGAKSSMDSIFVLTGYDQDKETGVLTNQQVATNFTFIKNLESSILPVIINDVAPEWLTTVSTVLKNAAENSTSGDRGNADQSITRHQLRRALNITTNEIVIPTDDAAGTRRYITEKYTAENKNRQNIPAFMKFTNEIQQGFMFVIFQELFDGKNLAQVVNEIAQTGDGCGLVNYGIGLVNNLCDKYGVQRFPAYTTDSDDIPDSFQELVEWLQDQWARLNATDDFGRPVAPYPEISKSEIDVDEMGNFRVYWFTGTAYKKVQKKLNFPHRNVTTLFANYIESGHIQIAATNKFHKFNGVAGRAFALRVYQEGLP